MEDLPTDILLHELGSWLYPFERFKLCGIGKIFNHIFSINNFKFNENHYKYDCNYYTKHLQQYLHDGICNLSLNAMSQLNKLQLQHLKYFIIFHDKLYKIYKSLLPSSTSSTSSTSINRHISSLSSSKIQMLSNNRLLILKKKKKRKSSTNLLLESYENNPFLKALKCIHTIDINKSPSSFAIKPYNIIFLCDILLCGFNVNTNPKPPKIYKYKSLNDEVKYNENRMNKPFSLNLSGNNLNATHIALICKSLLNRDKILNLNKLDLSINHNISDLCVRILFKCIGQKCHKLTSIDLSYANITDLSCDTIYNFYYKYFIQNNHISLHKIDLSFTRISENGLLILDELFNELPKSIKYIHNKQRPSTPKNVQKKKNIKKNREKAKSFKNREKKNISAFDDKIDPLNHRRSKSQSFEIVLKGCFFEPMLCKNYNCLASIPKLQTHCCINPDTAEMTD